MPVLRATVLREEERDDRNAVGVVLRWPVAPDVRMVARPGLVLMDDELWMALIGLIICGLMVFGLVKCSDAQEDKVDRQIQSCLNQGGTPIVVGHQYTSEFKGCNLP